MQKTQEVVEKIIRITLGSCCLKPDRDFEHVAHVAGLIADGLLTSKDLEITLRTHDVD